MSKYDPQANTSGAVTKADTASVAPATANIDEIARALSMLRRRRGGPQHHGDHHGGPHRRGRPHDHDQHDRQEADLPQRRGNRRGELAWIRMLDALASSAGPLSVSELGEAIGVDQPRASRLVQHASKRGMVRREADPEDARRTRIALTDEGRSFVERMKRDQRANIERALTNFSDEERAELARLLSKLAANWGE